MDSNFKNIKIGFLVKKRMDELCLDDLFIMKSLNISSEALENIYQSENISTDILLKLSKLLKYDFFRIYSQHLMLYLSSSNFKNSKQLPQFRKNMYTKEIVDFILELIENKEKTRQQVINEYRIPKTTLYKWLSKYGKN